MDSVTQQNAALVEQATAAAESLMQQAVGLRELLERYTVDAPGAAAQKVRGPHADDLQRRVA